METRTVKYSVYNRNGKVPKRIADTTEITLPDLEYLTETLSGAGINGEIDLPTLGQLSAATLSISERSLGENSIEISAPKTQSLELRWAAMALNETTGTVETVDKKLIFKGLPKKLTLGKLAPNSAEESALAFEMLYLKYIVKGVVKIEIDKLNDVFKVNGVDYNAAIKNVL